MYSKLLEDTLREFPSFTIVKKYDSRLMRAIDLFLRIISFGLLDSFMTGYTTTLGTTMYVTSTWDKKPDVNKAIVLRHEREHMRQARRYTRPVFSFLYLFVFFPVGLAYFRAKFEKEAYEETIRATLELRGRAVLDEPGFRDGIIKQFTGPAYMFMWPFKKSMERWYTRAVDRAVERAHANGG